MPIDSSFYFIAIPAVLMVGMSKGGMGEVLGLLAVPLLSFVVAPVQAAAIMLPILVCMDMASLYIWRKHGDNQALKYMLPGAIVGIAFGWATSAIMPSYVMRLIIGGVALSFTARFFYTRYFRKGSVAPRPHNLARASLWSSISGYGSFVAHAGGAPYQVYALPLGLPPREYTGTAVRFFAIVNAIKLVPYYALGQLDVTNLYLSATLFPLAVAATFAGAFLVKRMHPDVFYPFMYAMCALAGVKLTYDGLSQLVRAVF